MGGKSGTSTSTVSVPPQVLAQYNAVNANAQSVASTPFQQYSSNPNAFVAPLTSTQQAGITNTNSYAGAAQPYYGQAASMTGDALNQANANYGAASGQVDSAVGLGQSGLGYAANAAGQAAQAGQAGTQYASGLTDSAVGGGQSGTAYASGLTNNAVGAGQAGLAGAAMMTNNAATNPSQYFSPFLGSAYSAMLAGENNQNQQQQSALNGTAIENGAFGGDRTGIAQANLAYQQNLANNQTNSAFLNQGYQQAQQTGLAAAQQEGTLANEYGQMGLSGAAQQGNLANQYGQLGLSGAAQQGNLANQYGQLGLSGSAQQGAYANEAGQLGLSGAAQQGTLANMQAQTGLSGANQIAGLGTAAQTSGLQGAAAQLSAGQQQQETQQAGLTALYNQFLQQQSYPFQTAQFLANIAEGTGSLSGSTTTSTQPTGLFGNLLSDRRAKYDIERVGTAKNKLPIYKFKYKGDPSETTHVGFMADEVEKKHPEAIGLAGGLKTVDYDKATRAYGGLVARSRADGGQTQYDPDLGPYGAAGGLPAHKTYVPSSQSSGPGKIVFQASAPRMGEQQQNGLMALNQDVNNGKSLYQSGQSMLMGSPRQNGQQGSQGLFGNNGQWNNNGFLSGLGAATGGRIGKDGGGGFADLGDDDLYQNPSGSANGPVSGALAMQAHDGRHTLATAQNPSGSSGGSSGLGALSSLAGLGKDAMQAAPYISSGISSLASLLALARGGLARKGYDAGGGPYDDPDSDSEPDYMGVPAVKPKPSPLLTKSSSALADANDFAAGLGSSPEGWGGDVTNGASFHDVSNDGESTGLGQIWHGIKSAYNLPGSSDVAPNAPRSPDVAGMDKPSPGLVPSSDDVDTSDEQYRASHAISNAGAPLPPTRPAGLGAAADTASTRYMPSSVAVDDATTTTSSAGLAPPTQAAPFDSRGRYVPPSQPAYGSAPGETTFPQSIANWINGRESDGKYNAQASTSGAYGLGQFIPSTLQTVYARHPDLPPPSAYYSSDPSVAVPAQQAYTNAHVQDQMKVLSAQGLDPSPGNIHMNWFLGESGGPRFIKAMQQSPDAPAYALAQPNQVNANKNIFFDKNTGQPRTAQQVYAMMAAGAPGSGGGQQQQPQPGLGGATAYSGGDQQQQGGGQQGGLFSTIGDVFTRLTGGGQGNPSGSTTQQGGMGERMLLSLASGLGALGSYRGQSPLGAILQGIGGAGQGWQQAGTNQADIGFKNAQTAYENMGTRNAGIIERDGRAYYWDPATRNLKLLGPAVGAGMANGQGVSTYSGTGQDGANGVALPGQNVAVTGGSPSGGAPAATTGSTSLLGRSGQQMAAQDAQSMWNLSSNDRTRLKDQSDEAEKRIISAGSQARDTGDQLNQISGALMSAPDLGITANGPLKPLFTEWAARFNNAMDNAGVPKEFRVAPDDVNSQIYATKLAGIQSFLQTHQNDQNSQAALEFSKMVTPSGAMPRGAAAEILSGMYVGKQQALDKANYVSQYRQSHMQDAPGNYNAANAERAFGNDHPSTEYGQSKEAIRQLLLQRTSDGTPLLKKVYEGQIPPEFLDDPKLVKKFGAPLSRYITNRME